jgi:outer membrane protein TolC
MTGNRISTGLALSAALMLTPSAPICGQEGTSTGAPAVHLTLPAAVDMAMAHNHKVELARLSVRDSEEQKRVAQSHFYPVLRNESAVLHITDLQGIVIPAGALGSGTSAGLIPAQTLRIDQGASTGYSSGTELSQPMTQLFRVHAGLKAAEADLASSRIQADDTGNTIALQVHQLYYSYLIEQVEATAAQDAADAAATTETENQQSLQEGKLLADAELSSRATLLDKKRAVLVSKLNLDDLTLQLDDVLGLPMGTKLVLDPSGLGDSPVLPTRAEAVNEILQKNPSVLEAQQGVQKAKAGLAAARDAYIPDISGFARDSYQSGLPFLVHNFGTFGASVTYELFNGGAREANVRDAKVKLSMAETQLAQAEDDVRVQVSAAYDKVETLEELVKVVGLTLEAREESLRIDVLRAGTEAELPSGVASARSAVTSARANVLEAKLNLYLAQNNVLTLLGQRPR